MLKIAHISDLHLYKPSYGLLQFFSKRWLGNLNSFFLRQKHFQSGQLLLLPELFENLKVDYVVVSGDLSSTSLKDEFSLGLKIIEEFHKRGIKTFIVPGNHDHYTKKAHKRKVFYDFFTNRAKKKYDLKKDGVEAVCLKNNWWLIGLDCTLATNLMSSRGVFSKEIEKNLLALLGEIPKEDSIILVNHFPFLKAQKRKELLGSERLVKIIKESPNIKIYLHGHTHKDGIFDLRNEHLPIVLDSGSSAHNLLGKWNLLEINSNLKVSVFEWMNKKNIWKKTLEKSF